MKKTVLIFALALALLFPSSLWAAAVGTCTQSLPVITNSNIRVLTFTCTASVDDGSFPSTATSDAITAAIKGMYITEVRTNPGSTAPQALYDIVINDTDGIDLMGGTLANRSATASERAIPALVTGIYGGTAVDGALTLVITGNNVNSAGTVVKVFLTR
jgi:hypothetical protein